jgi:dCTP deaminase
MIINGRKLYDTRPLTPMADMKLKEHGVSYGLSEAGYDLRIKQTVTLHPFKRFALASTIEKFDMPQDLVAVVHDKSTWARKGLSVFNTVIEPDWRGWLTLELVYYGWKPLRIPAGAGIAQAIFHRIEEPASYGNGKYQNQEDQPVGARQ